MLLEVEQNKNAYVEGGDVYDFYIINIPTENLILIEEAYPITKSKDISHVKTPEK